MGLSGHGFGSGFYRASTDTPINLHTASCRPHSFSALRGSFFRSDPEAKDLHSLYAAVASVFFSPFLDGATNKHYDLLATPQHEDSRTE